MSIGSQHFRSKEPEKPNERVVVWQGYKYKRRDGGLWCTMEELEH